MKYYTTIEQSKKLVELGIDVYTADMINMCYSYTFDGKEYTNCKYKLRPLEENEEPFMPELNIPSWSTEALLKLLPDKIEINQTLYFTCIKVNNRYILEYQSEDGKCDIRTRNVCDTLIKCAFEMIVKLKEMKLI